MNDWIQLEKLSIRSAGTLLLLICHRLWCRQGMMGQHRRWPFLGSTYVSYFLLFWSVPFHSLTSFYAEWANKCFTPCLAYLFKAAIGWCIIRQQWGTNLLIFLN